MGCIPTCDCDVFSSRGHNVSDLDITGSRKVGAPIFSGRAHFFMDWVLYMVLKKMDLVFILASLILVFLVGAPTFYMDWVLYMVLKKMNLIFILVSPILVLTKVVMKYLVFCFLFF